MNAPVPIAGPIYANAKFGQQTNVAKIIRCLSNLLLTSTALLPTVLPKLDLQRDPDI